MAVVPITPGSQTIPAPQLPASNNKSSQGLKNSSPLTHSPTNRLTPLHSLNSTQSVEWYSLGTEPTENTILLLMWVAWYRKFHWSGTIHLVPDCVATPLPAGVILLRDITEDVACSSVACVIIVTLISCLLFLQLVMALYVLRYILVDVMIFPITDLLYSYLSHLIEITFTKVTENLMTKVHCGIKKLPNLWEATLHFIFNCYYFKQMIVLLFFAVFVCVCVTLRKSLLSEYFWVKFVLVQRQWHHLRTMNTFRGMSRLLPSSSHAEKYVESELCTLHYVGNFKQTVRKVFILIFLSE
jgi:hypothetical protein